MRGYPILRLILTVIVFALIGVAVWAVTKPSHVQSIRSQTISDESESDLAPVELQIEFISPTTPTHYEAILDGNPFVTETPPSNSTALHQSFTRTINYPLHGADIIINAQWPSNTPTALRVIIRRNKQILATGDFWGEGKITDVLTLPSLQIQKARGVRASHPQWERLDSELRRRGCDALLAKSDLHIHRPKLVSLSHY